MAFWTEWDPVLLYAFLAVWRFLWVGLDKIIDLITGYSLMYGSRDEREKSKNYENSAQLVNIWGRGNYYFLYRHDLNNFAWRHVKYVNPKHILENDDCTLMGTNPTHSFFCVTGAFDMYNPRSSPFVFMMQFLGAKQLIIVPNTTLHRLAAEIGDPDDRKVSVVNMTARCGSTLLCQIFANVPKLRAQSEPWAFVHLQGMYIRKEISQAEYEALLRSIMRVQCKKEHREGNEYLMIKNNCFAMAQFPLLKKMFPKFKFIYNTRQVKPSLKSVSKVIATFPPYTKNTAWKAFMGGHMSFPNDKLIWWERYADYMKNRLPTSSNEEDFTFGFAGHISDFLETKEIYDDVVLYEDLKKDAECEVRRLFKILEIDEVHVPAALEAMKHDSQNGVLGAPGTDHIEITDEHWKRIDNIFQENGVPITTGMSLAEFKKVLKG